MYHINSSELIVSNTCVVKFWVTLDLSIFAYPRFDLQKNHYARFLYHYYSVCARRPIRTHMNVHIMPISIYPMFGLRVILWIMEKIVKIYQTCESFLMNNNICVSTKWRRPIKCFYLLKVSALWNSSQKSIYLKWVWMIWILKIDDCNSIQLCTKYGIHEWIW